MFSQQQNAPIDPARLQASLAESGNGHMLPREAYVDPAVLAWEQANFFHGWVCVGRADDLLEVGQQKALAIGPASVLMTRAEDGSLHAFANTCRHRGHELLPCGATTKKKGIVCPYHAWSYRLDGSLLAAPSFGNDPAFDASSYGLVELPSYNWHGWVYVDTSGTAGDFLSQVGALDDIVSPYSPETLRVMDTHEYEIAANWKIIVENYQECYHCSMIHPELCQVSPPESGSNLDLAGDWVGGWMELRPEADTMSLTGKGSGPVIDGLNGHEARTVMYICVFPNLLVSLHPDYIMTHRLTPLTVDRTHVECAWLFPSSAANAEGFDPAYAVDFWDLTNRQDWSACESVQRGLTSEHAMPGPLAPEEDGVLQFVARIARGYLRLPQPAPTQAEFPAYMGRTATLRA